MSADRKSTEIEYVTLISDESDGETGELAGVGGQKSRELPSSTSKGVSEDAVMENQSLATSDEGDAGRRMSRRKRAKVIFRLQLAILILKCILVLPFRLSILSRKPPRNRKISRRQALQA